MRYVLINQQTHKAVAAIVGCDFHMGGVIKKAAMTAEQQALYRAITSVINVGGAVLPEGSLYEIPLEQVEEWCPGWSAKLGRLVGYTYLPGNCPEGTLTLHTVWAK